MTDRFKLRAVAAAVSMTLAGVALASSMDQNRILAALANRLVPDFAELGAIFKPPFRSVHESFGLVDMAVGDPPFAAQGEFQPGCQERGHLQALVRRHVDETVVGGRDDHAIGARKPGDQPAAPRRSQS